ncbi:MAG TPA: DUF5825 family protein [Streptosporangiaceae bacterium]|jgi:hypothetical protein
MMQLTLWRDHDPVVNAEPGMGLGTVNAIPEPVAAAAAWYRRGVRMVAFTDPVDLTGDPAQAVARLVLIRELTAHGMAIDWALHADEDLSWRDLSHLYPPTSMSGVPGDLLDWQAAFRLCRCVHRFGPGFVQIRDRRFGGLRRTTVKGPDCPRDIETLMRGSPEGELEEPLVRDLTDRRLVGRAGTLLWWLPYRVRRWPVPAWQA